MSNIERSKYGNFPDGRQIDTIRLTNTRGTTATFMTLGATLISFTVKDTQGAVRELTLGRDTLDEYLSGHPFFGSTVGRVANRIAGGRYEKDGEEYLLVKNKELFTLHGGNEGFDKKVWEAFPKRGDQGSSIIFTYTSADGEEGFPGTLDVKLVVTLTNEDVLTFEYGATTDKTTPVNLTNHTYWNLDGAPTIENHVIGLDADRYVPVADTLLPTGEIAEVEGTRFDLRRQVRVGETFGDGGFDHSFQFSTEPGTAEVSGGTGGLTMTLETNKPAVQFYTGNFLEGVLGRAGTSYGKHAGFCLETQFHPDAVNNEGFGPIFLFPGETYRFWTKYRFIWGS